MAYACRCVLDARMQMKHWMHAFTHVCESVWYVHVHKYTLTTWICVFILLKRVRRCVYVCGAIERGKGKSQKQCSDTNLLWLVEQKRKERNSFYSGHMGWSSKETWQYCCNFLGCHSHIQYCITTFKWKSQHALCRSRIKKKKISILKSHYFVYIMCISSSVSNNGTKLPCWAHITSVQADSTQLWVPQQSDIKCEFWHIFSNAHQQLFCFFLMQFSAELTGKTCAERCMDSVLNTVNIFIIKIIIIIRKDISTCMIENYSNLNNE